MGKIPFFKSKNIAEGTFQIENAFTGGFSTYAYLLEGKDYALLIDTIMGWGDLKAYCATLTDKPVKVVNTHAHWDHIGGNFHFDSCYMPVRDIPYFQTVIGVTKDVIFAQAKMSALDEFKELLVCDDNFSDTKPLKVFPLSDGDIFDLGDRKVEVVEVGGHTPGSIVLIDDKTRIAFCGDACNGNTLLEFKTSLPVNVYLQNLRRLAAYSDRFDMMYGGHEVFDKTIIEEGIETAERVVNGTDEKYPAKGIMGYDICYAVAKNADGTNGTDGKRFNMSYDPGRINGTENTRQIITAEMPVLC